MLSTWSWIFLNLIIYVNTTPLGNESETEAFLELTELDYEDACYNITSAQWPFIVEPSSETLFAWVNMSREARAHVPAIFKKRRLMLHDARLRVSFSY